jgi:hypothetical protein
MRAIALVFVTMTLTALVVLIRRRNDARDLT